MHPLLFKSYTVVSALGRGIEATYQALRDQRSGLQACDFLDVKLNAYIGRVKPIVCIPLLINIGCSRCVFEFDPSIFSDVSPTRIL